ncbi:MAG: zinc ribbon domain-containing protein [Oscillospiraceae bacterium]|nr:zinc ribbon domain-containing protein [Oscillospiraceae bacterium]
MFCKDCGAQLSDDTQFCPNCGNAQVATPSAEPVDFANKVRATAQKLGFSTAFLIATICLTFVQVLGLFLPAGNAFETYSGTVLTVDLLIKRLSSVMDIVGIIPGILITLGLWITFFSCATRKAKVNTSGLTMIFVVNLVQMVVSSLILLCVLLLTVIALPEVNYFNHSFIESSVLKPVLIALLISVSIIFVFVLIYYIKVCTTISNIRSTLKTGVPNKKVSRFVAIMSYISGGILILSGIFSLLSAGIVTLDSYYDPTLSYALPSEIFLSAVTSLLTATAQIIFGALIFTYRRKMAALEEEDRLTTFQTLSHAEPYTAPVYIPPEPVSEVINEPNPVNEELEETKRWDC